jgi:hypothetical protein
MGVMTTSSSVTDTERPEEIQRRRREERLDRIVEEAEELLEQIRRHQIRLEVIDELEERRRFGAFRRR